MLKKFSNNRWSWPLLVIALIIVALVSSSCDNECEKKVAAKLQKDYKMSEYEAQTGAAHMIRYALSEKKIKRNPDGSSYFPIDYSAINDGEKTKFLADKADGYREILEKDAEWQYYFSFFEKHGIDLRASIKEKMILAQWWQWRFEARLKHREFKRLISEDETIKPEKMWFVDACAVYPFAETTNDLVFKPPYVINTKEIKETERLEITWELMREIANPDYPNVDPVKKKIWKAEKYRLRILTFDINPFDRKPDFVEVYRLNKDGAQEEYPIISVFHTDTTQDLTVAVINLKKKDEIGFGVPDTFETVNISKGSDLLNSYSELLDKSLLGKEMCRKKFPVKSCQEIYLVQPGDVGPTAEINPNGWTVPFEYKFKKNGRVRNFTPLVKFETPNGNFKELGDPPYVLEHIALQYHARDSQDDIRGRVVEFYRPSDELKNKRIIEAKIRADNLLEFVFEHGTVVVMTPEKALGNLFRADYDYDSKRAAIEDKNNDGKLESKTIINKPTDLKLVDHAKH